MGGNSHIALGSARRLATRLLSIAVLIIVAGSIPMAGAADAAREAPGSGEIIRVGVYPNPPLIIPDDTGGYSGIAIDVLESVAASEGWRIEYVPGSWAETLQHLDDGDIDIAAVVAHTPERAREYAFTHNTLLSNWGVVFALPSNAGRYTTLSDMDGLSIAALRDDVYLVAEQAGLRRLIASAKLDITVTEHDTYEEVIAAVKSGRADAGLANRLVIFESQKAGDIRPTPIVLFPVSIRYAGLLGDTRSEAILDVVDSRLSDMLADENSPYFRALATYLATPPPDGPAESTLPDWALYSALGAALITALMALVIMVLRRVIRGRTQDMSTAIERLRAFFEALPDAVFVIDSSDKIIDFKPARDFETAIPPEEFIGVAIQSLSLPKEFLDKFIATVHEARAAGTACSVEYSLPDPKAGVERHYEARMMHAGADEVVAIVRDISRRVATEKQERRKALELESAVAERTAELVDTNLQLVAASQAKSVFLANMSHELRTPLNSIIGFSGTLASGLAGDLTDEQKRQTEMINVSGRHLLSLVNDVLDLSSVESGRLTLAAEDVDLDSVIEEAVGTIRTDAQSKGLAFLVDGPPLGVQLADRRKLLQVLLNLLGNAVKFTSEGHVAVHTRRGESGQAIISVEDTGPGIPAEEIEYVFQDFYQVRPTDGGKAVGFGLGLAISKRLVQIMEGTLKVKSEEGAGTTFTITLPQLEATATGDSEGRDPHPGVRG